MTTTPPDLRFEGADQYTQALLKLVELSRPFGHELTAFAVEDGPRHFLALDPVARQAVLEPLLLYVEAAEQVVAGGARLTDDRVFFWQICKRLGVRPQSDVLGYVQQGDVIEIYDVTGRQVFRNWAFFSLCSYTLDDLFSRPLPELVGREAPLADQIEGTAFAILAGKIRGTQLLNYGRHRIHELCSQQRRQSEVEHILFSPLHDSQGQVTAMVTTTRVYSTVSLAPAP